jgi:hypothetical protein
MTTSRRLLKALTPTLCLAVVAACYNYVPLANGAPPPIGSEFRAQLTEEGSTSLAPILGPQVAMVEGRVSDANDSAYVVSVSATMSRAQRQTFWTGESVTLPRATVQTMEARTLNRRKTWLIAAVGVIGGVLTAQIFGLGGSASGGDGGGGGPPPP